MQHERRFSQAGRVLVLAALIGITALVAHARAKGPAPDPVPDPVPVTQAGVIEVAFVLDTTGSMSGLIEGAKRKIWSIASELSQAPAGTKIRFALVGYRDRGDDYVTRVHGLDDDLDAVYAKLQGFAAAGGGDGPESVNQALHEAVETLAWSRDPGAYRVIFLVGDAPPHMDYDQDVHWQRTLARARERDILVNAIQCGGLASTQAIWQQIAQAGGGDYAQIAQDGAMVAVTTPYDEGIASLGRELADTMIGYGSRRERDEIADKRSHAKAAAPEVAATRLGSLKALGYSVNTGRADLVEAVEQGKVKASDLPEEELPAPLRAMSPAERDDFVEGRARQRRELERQVAELNEKREAHLASERENLPKDGFDAKVKETVRKQASDKGLRFEER